MKGQFVFNRVGLLCLACAAAILARYVRPRAFPQATFVFSTPHQSVAATWDIVPPVESLPAGFNLTATVNDIRFKDEEHQLTASWSYIGGRFRRDLYRITTTFDGSRETATVSLAEEAVVVLARDGYELRLHSDDSALNAVLE